MGTNGKGQVWLAASNQPIPTETGTAVVSGTLDASKIHLLGERVALGDVEIYANGDGGTLLIEAIEDYINFGDITNASEIIISAGEIITITPTPEETSGGVIIVTDNLEPETDTNTPDTDTSGETSGEVIIVGSVDPGTNPETPDTDTSGETPETDADTSDSDTANSGTNTTDTKIIGDNGRTINIGSTDSSISPVVNNVVDAVIQSVNRTSPSLPLTLQPNEVDPILEWTGNIVKDTVRANNFNRNRGLEALVNTQRHWDNFLEAVKAEDTNGITRQRISDAVINQMQTDIGQEINQRYCSSARNGVDCEE
ncbi:MAG: hypothetical protein RID09_06145 [Coleofasciculus sp. G1-WW12-02]|uniref:hypothetical protein n=1 Tax=Coleofasciculus sp. G1-WW12-02 TaxID=3068483 RepID=UPI0032F13104